MKDLNLRRAEPAAVVTSDPDGYVWVEAGPEWRLVTEPKVCRRPHCYHQAIAELDRGKHTARGVVPTWWAYCIDHLYGRRITDDGHILERRRPPADQGER